MNYEQKIILRTLYIFVGVAMLVSIAIIGLALFSKTENTLLGSGIAALLTSIVILGLTNSKQVFLPRFLIPLAVFILTTYLICSGENLGLHDEAVSLYALSIILAGLLLGKVGIVVYGVATFLAFGIVGYLEINNVFVNRLSFTTTWLTVVVLDFIYLLVGLMAYQLVDVMTSSLGHIQNNESRLKEANQSLEDARSTLEARVQERTSSAEEALRAAEEARFALEAQMWQVTGQAQLNEALRQKQDPAEFASTLMSFLCRYLEFQAGTLYVFDGDKLQYWGGYGISRPMASGFDLGDGVVGQAVLEKRMLFINDIPYTSMRVDSGLISRPPSAVVVVPLMYDDLVLGAMELGSLNPIESRHIQFLSRVEESIGMAIRTAQTRQEVERLLQETQQQAEELQAQEEELRAANEELRAQAENYVRASKAVQRLI